MKFKAKIKMLPPNLGGRTRPIQSGYRPTLRFDKVMDGVQITVIGEGQDSGDVEIEPLFPEFFPVIKQGMEFDITEGSRLVGSGIVL